MALILPTPDELAKHSDELDASEAIQWGADLFTLATGLKTTPTDPFESRLVKRAILDMAWFLQADHENKEEIFSPFSSERIGSYSYSKMQQRVKEGDDTGVSAFDQAVAYFLGLAFDLDGGMVQTSSEFVFNAPFSAYDPSYAKTSPDEYSVIPPVRVEALEPDPVPEEPSPDEPVEG